MHEWQACKLTMHACVLSCFSGVCPFATVWTVASQAPLSIGFSRQEHSSGLFPLKDKEGFNTPEDRPDPGRSPALAGGSFTASATWEACLVVYRRYYMGEVQITISV